ncbi:MAG: permease [Coraliomargaritaceae bacterium]
MNFLLRLIENTWSLTTEMAPYMLLGFIASGLLYWLIHPLWIQRWLGRPGWVGIRNACIVGVPMPLCSCSVIPVATSLYKNGASRGATVSFLSSTPQTGLDSILATYSLMGGPFTIIRLLVSFLSGLVTGLLVEGLTKKPELDNPPKALGQEPPKSCCSNNPKTKNTLSQGIHYGCITLPAMLARTLFAALIIAGLIATILPSGWLENNDWSHGFTAFCLATLISLPLYVCATASIPMAYALVAGGFSPGAALVFLIVGPATNTATIATVWKLLGHKAAILYVTGLVLIAWLAGWLFNSLPFAESIARHQHADPSALSILWKHSTAALLLALLAFARYRTLRRSSTDSDQSSQ